MKIKDVLDEVAHVRLDPKKRRGVIEQMDRILISKNPDQTIIDQISYLYIKLVKEFKRFLRNELAKVVKDQQNQVSDSKSQNQVQNLGNDYQNQINHAKGLIAAENAAQTGENQICEVVNQNLGSKFEDLRKLHLTNHKMLVQTKVVIKSAPISNATQHELLIKAERTVNHTDSVANRTPGDHNSLYLSNSAWRLKQIQDHLITASRKASQDQIKKITHGINRCLTGGAFKIKDAGVINYKLFNLNHNFQHDLNQADNLTKILQVTKQSKQKFYRLFTDEFTTSNPKINNLVNQIGEIVANVNRYIRNDHHLDDGEEKQLIQQLRSLQTELTFWVNVHGKLESSERHRLVEFVRKASLIKFKRLLRANLRHFSKNVAVARKLTRSFRQLTREINQAHSVDQVLANDRKWQKRMNQMVKRTLHPNSGLQSVDHHLGQYAHQRYRDLIKHQFLKLPSDQDLHLWVQNRLQQILSTTNRISHHAIEEGKRRGKKFIDSQSVADVRYYQIKDLQHLLEHQQRRINRQTDLLPVDRRRAHQMIQQFKAAIQKNLAQSDDLNQIRQFAGQERQRILNDIQQLIRNRRLARQRKAIQQKQLKPIYRQAKRQLVTMTNLPTELHQMVSKSVEGVNRRTITDLKSATSQNRFQQIMNGSLNDFQRLQQIANAGEAYFTVRKKAEQTLQKFRMSRKRTQALRLRIKRLATQHDVGELEREVKQIMDRV